MTARRPSTPTVRRALLHSVGTVLGLALCAGPAAALPLQAPEGAPVILVTGSTDGLGREVARELAAGGAHVLVHGRNAERGQALVDEIAAEGRGSARFFQADFGELAEVHALADAILAEYDRLDVLVNNAGIWLQADEGRVLSEDGHELHFQVNYLAGFLLTRRLLPLLRAGAPSRIVNVASAAQTPIDFDNVMLASGYSDGRAYGQSKLAQILFTVDLAEALEGTGITTYALHPATLMDTNMVLDRGTAPRSSVDDGRDAVLNLVLGEGLQNGAYYNGTTAATPNAQALDAEARSRLRAMSYEWTGLSPDA